MTEVFDICTASTSHLNAIKVSSSNPKLKNPRKTKRSLLPNESDSYKSKQGPLDHQDRDFYCLDYLTKNFPSALLSRFVI